MIYKVELVMTAELLQSKCFDTCRRYSPNTMQKLILLKIIVKSIQNTCFGNCQIRYKMFCSIKKHLSF